MDNKIAVIMKDYSLSASFIESTHILVYAMTDNEWNVVKEVPVQIDFSTGMSELRNQLRNLIQELDDCRIIAGKEISGLPYSVFDRMGFDIFYIDELNDETLNGILSDIQAGNELERMRREIIENAKPVETSTLGIYFLDLIALQEECPEVSSKKALQGFLRETPFLELDLICSHLPPWLDDLGYEITANTYQENKIKAKIKNKFCK